MKQLFVLVDGFESRGYSVRVCVEGFKLLADNRRDTFMDALVYAHTGFSLPVIVGQLSDGHVHDLYRKLSS